jgi:pimeloyl-ACP methyl ester carboxylesterase
MTSSPLSPAARGLGPRTVAAAVLAALALTSAPSIASGRPAPSVVSAHRLAAARLVPSLLSARPEPVRVTASAVARRRPIRVGTVLIPPCRGFPGAWCTTIAVPYDYSDSAAGTIRLGFLWYPATSGHATDGTILAVQGGPGFPTSNYASEYRGIYGPRMLARRNLLLVDLRGTGMSSPFTCKALQNWEPNDGNAPYITYTGACGRQLNHTRRLIGRPGYVQASGLYTTANAARDVATLLGELQTGKVDLYGDSYGTFFGQTFTARYSGMLRSVTLDSGYPVSQSNPFYPNAIRTARSAFNLSCRRSVACHRAAPGSSWRRIGEAARYLRVHPVTGLTRTPSGHRTRATVGVNELIQLVNLAGSDSGVYRELDPAIRALLHHDDPVPLLRLTAEQIFPAATQGPVSQFSSGLYVATTCVDYPQPFSYGASFAERRREYARAVGGLPRHEFAPFSVREWTTESAEEFDSCLTWPEPQRPDPPITTPPPYAPSSLPVLVLSGDLDSLTTPPEGRQTARDMGPSARWILFHNDTHVNAMLDTFGCASGLVRQFVANPARLWRLNASCATRTPEVRVVGTYPGRLSAVAPAAPRAGNRADRTGLRLAAVADAVTGDAIWHFYYGDGIHGWGLRGGTCHFAGPTDATRITLRAYRWTTDTKVNGHALWNQTAGFIRAWLTVTGRRGRATLRLSYHDYVAHPKAAIVGRYRGLSIRAAMPAP